MNTEPEIRVIAKTSTTYRITLTEDQVRRAVAIYLDREVPGSASVYFDWDYSTVSVSDAEGLHIKWEEKEST